LFSKLSLSVDGFYHYRDNIILELQNSQSAVTGSPRQYANVGKVANKGFEATILYQSSGKKLRYFVEGNVSFARNKIIQTDELAGLPDNLKRTGHSVSQLFGMQSVGYYSNQDILENNPKNTLYSVRAGDIKYANTNSDGFINELDEQAIGNPAIPEWTFGATTGLEYRNFDFSMHLSAFASRSVMPKNNAVWIYQNDGNATDLAFGAWEESLREKDATYPRLTTERNLNNYRNSSFWLKHGAFLRLNNAEIGYSLPEKWMNGLKIKRIRFFVSGLNLLTISSLGKYNLDPETPDAGVSMYPVMRSWNVGVNVKF
jgi:hypothetical protein